MNVPIHVILNDRVLFRPLTGVGHYVRQLLRALQAPDAEITVHPFLATHFAPPQPRTRPVAAPSARPPAGPGWRGTLLRTLRPAIDGVHSALFRRGARRYDLYHEPNHIPIRCDTPTVTTIHDLSVLLHPEWHPADRVRWYERDFAAGVRQSCRFIAASEHTKREMVQHLGLPPEKIDVTYQAPRPGFHPLDPAAARHACAGLQLPERFFLYAGTLEPRKNVAGLLEAFAALPAALRRDVPLVLAGGWGWKMESLAEQLNRLGLRDDARLLGYLTDDTLAALYATCTALVWPTLYEGFGLPPLEAMACGCPVIVSNTTSLPEVVGDAGVLLDPHDTAAWAEALRRVVEDATWREQWRTRGRARAATFSWDRCAQQTRACYRAALATP